MIREEALQKLRDAVLYELGVNSTFHGRDGRIVSTVRTAMENALEAGLAPLTIVGLMKQLLEEWLESN